MTSIHKRKKRIPKQVGVTVKFVHTSPPPPPKKLPKSIVERKMVFENNGVTWKRTDSGDWTNYDPIAHIRRLQISYLVYSYLYYYLDITLIPDSHYDQICQWLLSYKKNDRKHFEATEYYNLCKDLDESGSGFAIREEDYPEDIRRVAVKLLNQAGQKIPKKLEGVGSYAG